MANTVNELAELTSEQREELLAELLREQSSKQSRRSPLSFAQQRLWLIDQMEGGRSILYNVPMPLRLRGELNVKALDRALGEIMRRHESLRTIFQLDPVSGKPVQVIQAWRPFKLECADIAHLGEKEREQRLNEMVNEDARWIFDLSSGPLVRLSLVKLGEQDHALMLNMHHIITDGWSIGVLIKELADLYTAYGRGEESPLKELPIQYADFAEWQRERWETGAFSGQMEYWRKQLGGELAVLDLPVRATKARVGTQGATKGWKLERDLCARVRELTRDESVTLFMTLLAAFQALLYRYSGQREIVVGTPIANRNRKEVEALIGFFVNTLVLRTELGGEPTFRQLLRRVRDVCLGAYKNQDVPFEKLVEELQPEREAGRNPLFQVMLVLQNAPGAEIEMPGLTLGPVETSSRSSMFDISLNLADDGQNIVASIHYKTELFDEDTISRMAACLTVLLEAAVSDPDKMISELPLLPDREVRQLLVDWNNTHREYPRNECIHDLFVAQASRAPDAVALICRDERLSYRELNAHANRLAHRLLELGMGPETRVGVLLDRTLDLPVVLLGILKAGGAYVPLDSKYPLERLSLMIADSGIEILITQKHLSSRVPNFSGTLICLDSLSPRFGSEDPVDPAARIPPQNLAYVIYTSGSTGRPKGVAIEHRSAATLLHWARDCFADDEIAVVLASTSICFDLSVFELFVPLSWGGTVLLAEDIFGAANSAGDCAITLINTVPSVISAMLQFGDIPESICTVNLAGEPLHRELAERIYEQRRVQRILNLYGPTEDTTYSTSSLIQRGESGPVTIGRPVANSQVFVLDGKKQLVPIGINGELHLGGAGLARGYLNRPDITAERFLPNPFRDEAGARLYQTGDCARYLPYGEIEFLGRNDFQVKVRGFRVELGEVEAALLGHPAVREAVVMAAGRLQHQRRLIAYVVLDESHKTQPGDLRSFLCSRLADYMIPSAILALDKLPLTSNGKVDRRALPVPDELTPEMPVVYHAARDGLELQLAQIWEEVLHVHSVGIRDNFFDLGGHSMLAISLIAQLRRVFDRDLPVSLLMEAPTIAELAAVLRRHKGFARETSLVRINRNGSKATVFFVHPIGGSIICYLELARRLGPDRPFCALQSRGLNGDQSPLNSIEEMAGHYISEMRAAQPAGPYLLGGWSMGGIIAFEMARQLEAGGESVDLLALVDATPWITNRPAEQTDETALLTMFTIDTARHWDLARRAPEDVEQLSTDDLMTALLEDGKKANVIPRGFELEQMRSLYLVFKGNLLAVWRYAPKVYAGKIVLYRAAEQPPHLSDSKYLGWNDWALKGVEEHVIPGDHYHMLREPGVSHLSDLLSKAIEKA